MTRRKTHLRESTLRSVVSAMLACAALLHAPDAAWAAGCGCTATPPNDVYGARDCLDAATTSGFAQDARTRIEAPGGTFTGTDPTSEGYVIQLAYEGKSYSDACVDEVLRTARNPEKVDLTTDAVEERRREPR